MQVPKRKAEKYTNIAVDPHMTQEKFDELKVKLDKMLESRPALAKDVQIYAANGDFSENAEYQIAKGKLRGLNQRILDTKDHLAKAEIIEIKENSGVAQVGSTVTIEADGKQKTYQILGSSEANPEKGIISYQSLIGSAIIGKRVHEQAIVQTPKREIIYTIIAVN